MQKIHSLIALMMLTMMLTMAACGGYEKKEDTTQMVDDKPLVLKNDSMIYGLVCDGTTDSVLVMWPFSGDPITYSTIDARQRGKVIGQQSIGDWVGVLRDSEDTTAVSIVVNMDQLKGTWTYPVMPVMKELQNMSRRAQRRMMANMSDSIKETYLVPREYGFTLKRNHKANSVGRIMRSNSLEEDSPVVYPEVKNYKQWYVWNGRLLLVSGERPRSANDTTYVKPDVVDTLQFVSMTADSLVLNQHGIRYSFHRKESAMKANEAATKAAARQDSIKNKATEQKEAK